LDEDAFWPFGFMLLEVPTTAPGADDFAEADELDVEELARRVDDGAVFVSLCCSVLLVG
jgi:hypothetical protein